MVRKSELLKQLYEELNFVMDLSNTHNYLHVLKYILVEKQNFPPQQKRAKIFSILTLHQSIPSHLLYQLGAFVSAILVLVHLSR